MTKVLHFSPVRKPSEIVKLHLAGLEKLKSFNFEVEFSFFDDNIDNESSILLNDFVSKHSNSYLHKLNLDDFQDYQGVERWVPYLYNRITKIKNDVIKKFLNSNYDYLFFTDSDLILHPNTLSNLLVQNKNFCSSIFWTQFKGSPVYTPNAWFSKPRGFDLNDLKRFKNKSTFPVDFTGACTLLSRKILEKNVSFEKIPNINYLGEDKHFCIRASVLGFQPYVNTDFPSFHIYTQDFLETGREWIEDDFKYEYLDEWLDQNWEEKVEKWLTPNSKSFLRRVFHKLIK
jgi:hypothetical protein